MIEKPIHILIVSQYFHPEEFRINDIALEWVRRGYQVTVLTGIPNYPKGQFFDGYDLHHRREETWKGIRIIRLPIVPRGKSDIRMVLNYFSFPLSGWLWQRKTELKADIVFTFEVSPMLQALIGSWYSKKHRIPHFLYVQDIWPESVESVTDIHYPILIRSLNRIIDYIYHNTDEIFVTAPPFVTAIRQRSTRVVSRKIHFWPQYAEAFYRPLDRQVVRREAVKESAVHQIPDDDRFKVIYTGNLGMAQGLEILPRAARILREQCKDRREVLFVIVGGGRNKDSFRTEIERMNVADSFCLIDRQPPEAIPELIACCDLAFVSYKRTDLFKKVIPAKLQSYMACGIPIVASAEGETERIIREADCGYCVPLGSARMLAKKIREAMAEGEELRRERGNRGRQYSDRFFNRTRLFDEMDQFIRNTIRQGNGHRNDPSHS